MNILPHTYAFITMLRSLQWQHYNFEWPKDPLWSECVFGCLCKRVSLFHHPAGWLFQPWCWGTTTSRLGLPPFFPISAIVSVELILLSKMMWSGPLQAWRQPEVQRAVNSMRDPPGRFHPGFKSKWSVIMFALSNLWVKPLIYRLIFTIYRVWIKPINSFNC